MSLKILIVDDHEVVHQGIKMILRSRPQWQVCGQAENGADAVLLAQELSPDAIVMDITMPVMNGLEATRQIAKLGLSSKVVVFTMHEAPGLAESVRGAGGHGLVLKSRAAIDLINAIETITGGGTYFNSDGSKIAPLEKKKRESGPLLCRALGIVPSIC
jgi:two-component system, NarL family, nitrate/nitrite response regulator NarL